MSIENRKFLKLLADYDKHCARISKATSIDIHELPEAKAKRVRRLEKDYVAWFEFYFPNFAKKKSAWFHRKLAEIIIKNKSLRLLAEMYRGAGKSVHIDMGIPLFLYLVLGEIQFMLLLGQTEDKANKLLGGIQSQLTHNNRLKNDYGEKMQHGDWSSGDFLTTDGVRFMALGFGQDPRGSRQDADRPDYIVVDDVDSKKHVNNDRLMREALDFLTEDVWGCFDSDMDSTNRFIYANNNFHRNSITNRLRLYFLEQLKKQEMSGRKSKTHFEVFRVCAVKNLTDFEPEWPERGDAEFWRDKYDNMPYRSFMREYMHVHIEEGKVFKSKDMIFKSPHWLREYDSLCFYGDLSYKANGDFKAMVLVGKKGREFHILLCYLRQKSRADVARWLYDTYEQFGLGNHNIRYLIEGLFAMDEFTNDFMLEGDQRGYHIPVRPDKKAKTDKFDRIESLLGFFEAHMVFFNEDYQTVDQLELINQFLAFEKGSQAHDDGPDACHGAFSYVNRRTAKQETTHVHGERVDNHY
ncbi:phage terminase large subunit [Belliella sp. DSM 107340]|uniref:Phage terminase large subunit n=1 Tax=Belliella calami TaxID=2923436 RepID=A0ABS9UU17_9BACT|nr:phage terminase large subunit [Belliella calami]MCH7400117.1 phage terminase large subunit [Belliella calami]